MPHLIQKIFIVTFFICLSSIVTVGQYRFDVWTSNDGIPQNSINGIFQASDGFIWFTTNDGIVRFDGVRFKVFDRSNTKGLVNNRFNFAFEDGSGRYWFRAEEKGIVLYENGTFKTFIAEKGLPDTKIGIIYNDRQGGILVGTDKGFYKYSDKRFVAVEIAGRKTGNSNAVLVYIDSKGGIWWSGGSGLRRVVGDKITDFGLGVEDLNKHTIFEDRLGNFWVGRDGEILMRIYENRVQKFNLVTGSFGDITEDIFGNVWLGHSKGLTKISSEAVKSAEPLNDELQTFTEKDGLSNDLIISIAADREGSVWAGSIIGGLNQITPQSIKVFSADDWNSPDENIYPVLEDSEKNVWLGAWTKTLVKYEDGDFSTYQAPINISSLFEDSKKHLWVGTLSGVYLFEGKQFKEMTDELGIPPATVFQTINEDRQNNLWFGTGNDGLIRYKDGKTTIFTKKNGLPDNKITSFLETKDGKIYVGTPAGLVIFENDKFRVLTEKDGLTSNYIRSFYEDSEGILWIGTYDNGLSRYKDGKFTNYTVKDGLYSKNVFCILEDDNGWFWMNSNTGIYRVLRRELEEFAEGKIRRLTSIAYNTKDGLKSAEGNGERHPAGIKRENGEMWFPTLKGVAVVKPTDVRLNKLLPPVHFDEILIDGEDIGKYGDEITLKPGQESLEINYTALSFINPELVRFRYRLKGFDEKWIDAGTRRFAFYTNLKPGEYEFELQAANRDGIWNREGTSLKITVEPHFYETSWFLILVYVSVIGIILLAYFYRIRQLKQIAATKTAFAKQLIESQEAERKRIAGELHDGLGQSLVIIKNRAMLGEEEKDFEEYGEISDTATNALGEVREIIYNLRPQHLERVGLTKAIKGMLKRISGIINFQEDIDSIDGLFSENVEINVYRIVQECVNNVIKHSEATSAKVSIKSKGSIVQIIVKDNGKGFDIEQVKEKRGGFGLVGLEERVRLLGGDFAINSEFGIGFGTTVEIQLPINV